MTSTTIYANDVQLLFGGAPDNLEQLKIYAETFQITMVVWLENINMENKVKNRGMIFDSRLSFEHHIKSLCSRFYDTLSYLNRVKNTLDQKSRIFLINVLMFSCLNYCSSIWGKCCEKLQYGVQKYITFSTKLAGNGKYFKQNQVNPLL